MAESAFFGAAADLLLRVKYDALKAAAGSAARNVFSLSKICSQLEEDLNLYEPFLKQIFDTMDSRAESRVLEKSVLNFKETIDKGTKLLEECKQISIWYPWRRIRFGKKILRLGKEIRQFLQDNRLVIIGISQIQMQLDLQSEALHKELLEDMKKVKESMMIIDDGKVSIVADSKRDPTSSSSSSSSSAATPPLPRFVVGLEQGVEKLRDMLLSATAKKAVIAIVGGMAGIGKTTLAKAICKDQQVREFFQGRIYFITVSLKPDMVALFSTIWSEVTKDRNLPRFQNEEDAFRQLQCKLESHMRNSKCLLVLDDVWSVRSMQYLIMTFNIPGLWTLLTTRNARMLEARNYTLQPYILGLLDSYNASRLFCYWAFGNDEIPSWADKKLVEEIIRECKGLPLALKVIGRWLSNMGKNEEAWRQARDKLRQAEALEQYEQKLLFDRLRTSVDDLDEQLQDCFMDLGAFPEDSETPVDLIMDIWMHVRGGMDSDDAYCILVELSHRCLLDLSYKSRSVDIYGPILLFSQHVLLRDLALQLGRRNNSPKVEEWRWLLMPQKRPSLPQKWQLLSHPTVAAAAQIISIHTADGIESTALNQNWPSLNLPNGEALLWYEDCQYCKFSKDHIYQLPSFIGNMPKLKVLIVIMSFNSEYFIAPFKFRAPLHGVSGNGLRSLYIDARNGTIDTFYQYEVAGSTQYMKWWMPNLKNKYMNWSMPNLKKLTIMTTTGNVEIENLGLGSSLEILKLSGSYYHSKTPSLMIQPSWVNLKVLDISFGYLKELLIPCDHLTALEELIVRGCESLRKLPRDIGKLQSLKELNLHGVVKLQSLPDSLSQLSCLETLDLSYCWGALKHLPHGIGELQSLKVLNLRGAYIMESLPDSLSKLSSLETLDISNCLGLKDLPDSIRQLPSVIIQRSRARKII